MTAKKLLRDPWVFLMLAVDFVLLGVLLGSLVHPLSAPVPVTHPIDLPALATTTLPEKDQATGTLTDRYALLIGQPIFQQDRKYTPPPKVDDTAALTPPPDFVVTGFLAIPGRPGKAFLRERSGSRTLTTAVGDSVDGWTVEAVSARQVHLRQGERSVDLVRNGAPIAGAATGSPSAVLPTAREPQPASSQPAPQAIPPSSPAGMISSPPNSQAQPVASAADVKATETPAVPGKKVTVIGTLQGVFVTAWKQKPFTPAEASPPVLISPRGPLLTYKPSLQDGN